MAALEKMEIKLSSSKEVARAYLESIGVDFSEQPPIQTEERFPYITARLWYPDQPVTWKNLCIYSYGSQVLFGDKSDAEGFLEYVNRQKKYDGTIDVQENNPYKTYRINFEEWK